MRYIPGSCGAAGSFGSATAGAEAGAGLDAAALLLGPGAKSARITASLTPADLRATKSSVLRLMGPDWALMRRPTITVVGQASFHHLYDLFLRERGVLIIGKA